MQHVLLHPVTGYYMNRDVFGEHGDFITSPEISQIFGELLGVWIVNEWMQQDKPADFRLVELGPGRGTLLADILRVSRQFPDFRSCLSLHLVEISPTLAALQERTLRYGVASPSPQPSEQINFMSQKAACYNKTECLGGGVYAHWYQQLEDVPLSSSGVRTCFIAHEFFDALPVHKFQRDSQARWREVLVDARDDGLHYVLAPEDTPALLNYLPLVEAVFLERAEHVEVCPQAAMLCEALARRLTAADSEGGSVLLADYGAVLPRGDTLRGFRRHQVCKPLECPGNCDLTADVDFGLVRRALLRGASDGRLKLQVRGPLTQAQFLTSMGAATRLQQLLLGAGGRDAASRRALLSGAKMLLDPLEGMSLRFQFLSAFTTQGREQDDKSPAAFLDENITASAA